MHALLTGAAVAAVTGCSAVAPRAPQAVQSLLELRHEQVVLQEWDLSCGAAALATVLTFQHGDPVPENEIAREMLRRTDPLRIQHRGGFSLLDLKRYVEERGYRGLGYGQLTLQSLEKLGPAIVPIVSNGYSHFVVFRGATDGMVLLADPAFGNRLMSVPDFERAWAQNVGFVVEHPQRKDAADLLAAREELMLKPLDMAVRASLDF